jgi:hypothetical protein
MTSFQQKSVQLPIDDISYPREFAMDNHVDVLLANRHEKFDYERAVRLFQFQTWIFVPTEEARRYAGLIAATKILRAIELSEYTPMFEGEDYLPYMTLKWLLELRQRNPSYWSVYDNIIAAGGGLPALLEAPTPARFDSVVATHGIKARVVANLVDYRFRYALCGQGGADGANINHACFFNWWPTHEIPGRRGITVANKSASAKTMSHWWSILEKSAIFIYLHVKHGFNQFPPKANLEPKEFVDKISIAAQKSEDVRRLFSAYAYIADAIGSTTGEKPFIILPKDFPRTAVAVPPFSDIELQTIAQYEDYNSDMWQ